MGERKIEPGYMTIEQASEYSGIPVNTLRKKIQAKALIYYKPGKRILFRLVDIDNYIRGFKK